MKVLVILVLLQCDIYLLYEQVSEKLTLSFSSLIDTVSFIFSTQTSAVPQNQMSKNVLPRSSCILHVCVDQWDSDGEPLPARCWEADWKVKWETAAGGSERSAPDPRSHPSSGGLRLW